MTVEEHIKYWIDSAENDLSAAQALFQSAKYDWCLFVAHLSLEKTLKAYFVFSNENKIPPKIHNLLKLAEISGLTLSEKQKLFLDKVTDFNLEVRYPEYKKEFYKICTKGFAHKYLTQIKDFYKWLKSQIELKEQ